MFHTIIRFISDNDKHFTPPILEYEKRLGKKCTIHNIKPHKSKNTQLCIAKDTDNIITKINNTKEKIILLSKSGYSLSTKQRSTNLIPPGSKTIFIIGGPYGLDESRLQTYIQKKISFGSITLPHGLAKLTLLEQIYRVHTIHTGKKYHY